MSRTLGMGMMLFYFYINIVVHVTDYSITFNKRLKKLCISKVNLMNILSFLLP